MLSVDTAIAQWKGNLRDILNKLNNCIFAGLDWSRFVSRVDNDIIKQLGLEQEQILAGRKRLVEITKG
jgi:hypothetical protein